MSGLAKGKKKLGVATVYLHKKGESGATTTHIDIELDKLGDIIRPGEFTVVGGKEGGVFLGLKKQQSKRAEEKYG